MTASEILLGNVFLILAYMFYRILLAGSNKFNLNRAFLLVTPLLCLLLPLVSFQPVSGITSSIQLAPFYFSGSQTSISEMPFWDPLLIVYLFGAITVFVLPIVSYLVLREKENHTDKSFYRGIKVVTFVGPVPSHSFFYKIYLNNSDSHIRDWVLKHEYAHIAQKHSYDLLMVQILRAICWFNPVAYLWIKAVKENHEYLADSYVRIQSGDTRPYALALVSGLFPEISIGLSHSFSEKSFLRKRIEKLNNQKPLKMQALRYFMIIPFIALLTLVSCVGQNTDEIAESEILSGADVQTADKIASFPGGQEAMYEFLYNNIKYPSEAKSNKEEGRVYIEFTIKTDGDIADAIVKKGVSPSLDKEAIRAVMEMPDWIPSEKDGKAVGTKLILPISYALPVEKEIPGE